MQIIIWGYKPFFSRAHFFCDPKICSQYKIFGYVFFGLNDREKYLILLNSNCISAPTFFVNPKYINSLGGYNEEIPFIEDWPFWIKMYKEKTNAIFLNKETVKYRIGVSLSIGNGGGVKFKDRYDLVLSYAYKFQMEENPIYKMYAFFVKKQRENNSLLFSLLLRTNIYYYYKYLEMKKKWNSRKFYKQYKS